MSQAPHDPRLLSPQSTGYNAFPPLFDRFGRYACDVSLSVPTRGGFTLVKCLSNFHVPGGAEVVFRLDWIAASSAMLCDDRIELADPTAPTVASLPVDYHWSPNDGAIACHRAMLLMVLTHTFPQMCAYRVIMMLTVFNHPSKSH